MKAFLLTWNPNRWVWDNLQEEVVLVNTFGEIEDSWSTGVNKSIEKGDRLFLCKLGVDPKGIIGSGFATSSVYQDDHWDKNKSKQGIKTNYVNILFDALSEYPCLTEKELKTIKNFIWFPQASGISIPKEIYIKLEKLWKNKTRTSNHNYIKIISTGLSEGNRLVREIYQYERNLEARKQCIKIHGVICKICGFDFYKKYGNLGKNFIHIHHIKPISQIGHKYLVNPSKDLIPICPNCHAMIHKKIPAMSVKELIKIVKRANCT